MVFRQNIIDIFGYCDIDNLMKKESGNRKEEIFTSIHYLIKN